MLIGTIGVVTGFVFYSAEADKWLPFLFFFALILMGTWGVYGEICFLWNAKKIERLHELEARLHFHQHRDCDLVEYPWYLPRARWAARILALGVPTIFLFMSFSYYGIIVIDIGLIVSLYLRKQAAKHGERISDQTRNILDNLKQKIRKGKHTT